MNSREQYWRSIALLALLLCAILVGERYWRGYFLAATAPRQPAPRADFVGEEARTTALFAQTSPSVVAIYARRGAATTEAGGVGTGSGHSP